MWGWLRRSRRREEAEPTDVVMYTRRGCHLCDDAWSVPEAAQRRFLFHLSRVDIDSDPALVELYQSEVPVVTVAGRVYFRGRVNPVLLDRLLRGRSAGEVTPESPGNPSG